MPPPIFTASPIYPGHELCEDDPLGTAIRNHAPGFVGPNAQRLAYNTTGLRTSKTWYETDTGLTYQWSGSAWGLIFTPASINSIANSNLAQAPANTLKGNLAGATANVADNSIASVLSALGISSVGSIANCWLTGL